MCHAPNRGNAHERETRKRFATLLGIQVMNLQSFNPLKFPRSTQITLILWVLTMISLPIVGWTWGEAALIRGMSVGVVMQAIAVLTILRNAWGLSRTLRTLAIVAVLSYFAEWLGSKTGFPFGAYHYTDALQPQLAGVPLLIPLAWMMMLAPAWAIAKIITPKHDNPKLPLTIIYSLISALAFTAWDLFLDPQMVGWGFWIWATPGVYFGIPFSNYLGWLLVSFLLTLAARPRDLPLGPLAVIYALTWFLQSIGQGIFWGQPGPAAFGFVGMGIFILLAFRTVTSKN
jgi:lycopene beta-cyclase